MYSQRHFSSVRSQLLHNRPCHSIHRVRRAEDGRRPVHVGSSSPSGAEPAAGPSAKQQETWQLLKDYSLQSFRGTAASIYLESKEQREALRQTLMEAYKSPNTGIAWAGHASDMPPPVLIGLMAGDVRVGIRAFRDWCEALGLEFILPEVKVAGAERLSDVQGSVYVKYNPISRVCYLSPYVGKDRGVLMQMGQEQLGHFPLGMWDEELKNPPPAF